MSRVVILNFGTSQNIIRTIVLRGLRWTKHEAHLKINTNFWWVIMKERKRLEDITANWRIILKWIVKKLYECIENGSNLYTVDVSGLLL